MQIVKEEEMPYSKLEILAAAGMLRANIDQDLSLTDGQREDWRTIANFA
jgi:hypothetical protein